MKGEGERDAGDTGLGLDICAIAPELKREPDPDEQRVEYSSTVV